MVAIKDLLTQRGKQKKPQSSERRVGVRVKVTENWCETVRDAKTSSKSLWHLSGLLAVLKEGAETPGRLL